MWEAAFRKHLIKKIATLVSVVSSPLHLIFITKEKIRIPSVSYLYLGNICVFCTVRHAGGCHRGREWEWDQFLKPHGATPLGLVPPLWKGRQFELKIFMHDFREKEGNEPSLALLAESKTGRDKLGLEEVLLPFCHPPPLGVPWWNKTWANVRAKLYRTV